VTQILGFAGRKQAGKTTCAKFFQSKNPGIRIYSFADRLKWLCVELLGLEEHQVWGTDEQKNELTHIRWEDMPGYSYYDMNGNYIENVCMGPMTGRQILQYVGTNIFRKIYGDCWVRVTLRDIQRDNLPIAIIDDVRFPNEVTGINKAGGHVIKLTRRVTRLDESEHYSEAALDGFDFNPAGIWKIGTTPEIINTVLNNSNIGIEETCEEVYKIAYEYWGVY
jgi:hypothetical protein